MLFKINFTTKYKKEGEVIKILKDENYDNVGKVVVKGNWRTIINYFKFLK